MSARHPTSTSGHCDMYANASTRRLHERWPAQLSVPDSTTAIQYCMAPLSRTSTKSSVSSTRWLEWSQALETRSHYTGLGEITLAPSPVAHHLQSRSHNLQNTSFKKTGLSLGVAVLPSCAKNTPIEFFLSSTRWCSQDCFRRSRLLFCSAANLEQSSELPDRLFSVIGQFQTTTWNISVWSGLPSLTALLSGPAIQFLHNLLYVSNWHMAHYQLCIIIIVHY